MSEQNANSEAAVDSSSQAREEITNDNDPLAAFGEVEVAGLKAQASFLQASFAASSFLTGVYEKATELLAKASNVNEASDAISLAGQIPLETFELSFVEITEEIMPE
jgi:hypothetical protein